MWISPSTYMASSVTNKPKLVAAVTTPPNSSPRCSRMYLHLSQASTSRLASSARRSLALQCRPAACQAISSALTFFGFSPEIFIFAASLFSIRFESLAWASPGVGRAGRWYRVLPRMALITRCTSRSG